MKDVLIIDDEEYMRQIFARLVARTGLNVLTAPTGSEGISIFKKKKPGLVFLDIMLPGLDGLDVLTILRGVDKDVKIYFISGSDMEIDKFKDMNLNAAGYFAKPVNVAEIKTILDKYKEETEKK